MSRKRVEINQNGKPVLEHSGMDISLVAYISKQYKFVPAQ